MAMEEIYALPATSYSGIATFQGIREFDQRSTDEYFNSANPNFLEEVTADDVPGNKQVVIYIVIHGAESVLTYRRNMSQDASPLLRGRLCFGFGGHVNRDDFISSPTPSMQFLHAAQRELSEELQLDPRDRLELLQTLSICGLINDDSSTLGERHIAIVFSAKLSKQNNFSSVDPDINDLRWMTMDQIGDKKNELEKWSLFLLESRLISKKMMPSVIV